MPPAALPVFVQREFLSAGECAELCRAMDQAPHRAGSVREALDPAGESLDPAGRKASDCEVPDGAERLVVERIGRLTPELERRFGLSLAEYEAPHFVTYEPGDFYRPHRDLYRDVALPEPLVRRRLSMVVFLNRSSGPAEPEASDGPTYDGGRLRLCSHEAEEFDPDSAWDVPAERGSVVVFRADTWHEVTPVRAGRRYTVVVLLLAPAE